MGEERDRRVAAIDLLRGLVIVVMALDHVRDFSHPSGWGAIDPLNPAQSDPLLYATRLITHLCAPTFVFLAGVSARLQTLRGRQGADLARFLVTRGLWLIALELTVLSFVWSFALPYFLFFQVIWAIGWSMMILAALVLLPPWVALIVGLVVVAGHNAMAALLPPPNPLDASIWAWLYHGGAFVPNLQAPVGFLTYPVIPWFGIMAIGYGVGHMLASATRDRFCLLAGAAMIGLFLLLRIPNLYGNPSPWTTGAGAAESVMNLLNVSKYPPSLQFVCMTLGLALLLMPALARLPSGPARILGAIGAVPLMAYVAHLFLMHLVALVGRLVAGQDIAGMFDTMRNVFLAPDRMGPGVPLWAVYLEWAIVVALLVPLCLWWSGIKRRRKDWWLSYL